MLPHYTPCFHCLKRHSRVRAATSGQKRGTIVLVSHLPTGANSVCPGSIYNLLWQAVPMAYEKKHPFFFVINLYISFA